MSKYVLFLDDQRNPEDVAFPGDIGMLPIVVARSHKAFQHALRKQGLPEAVFLDHDLSPEHYREAARTNFTDFDYSRVREKTGLDCAKFLIEECRRQKKPLPRYYLHTFNPVGKVNMKKLLEKAKEELAHAN